MGATSEPAGGPVALPGLEPDALAVEAQRRRDVMREVVNLKLTADEVARRVVVLEERVGRLREAGVSWATIGLALGTTRQAAQQRYGRSS